MPRGNLATGWMVLVQLCRRLRPVRVKLVPIVGVVQNAVTKTDNASKNLTARDATTERTAGSPGRLEVCSNTPPPIDVDPTFYRDRYTSTASVVCRASKTLRSSHAHRTREAQKYIDNRRKFLHHGPHPSQSDLLHRLRIPNGTDLQRKLGAFILFPKNYGDH